MLVTSTKKKSAFWKLACFL